MPAFSKPALYTHSSPKFKNQSNLSTAGDEILYSISIPYQVCSDWCSESGHSTEKYTLILAGILSSRRRAYNSGWSKIIDFPKCAGNMGIFTLCDWYKNG